MLNTYTINITLIVLSVFTVSVIAIKVPTDDSGTNTTQFKDGSIAKTRPYKYGNRHGFYRPYDKLGKLTQTKQYDLGTQLQ